MSVLPATPLETTEAPVVAGLHLVPVHEHTWALRETEYDNGLALNRFECESCSAVRFT